MKRSLFLIGAALLVAVPAAALLPGCGGSGGGLLRPNVPAARTYRSNLTLNSSQNAQISVTVAGDRASGTLVVTPAVSSQFRAKQTGASVSDANSLQTEPSGPFAAGSITLAGTKTGGVALTLTGNTPEGVTPAGTFAVTLTFSSGNASSGTVSVKFNGVEVGTGTFDLAGSTTPEATATPTVDPTQQPIPQANEVSLTYSKSGPSEYGFGVNPFTSQEVAVIKEGGDTTIDVNRSLANPTDNGRRFTLTIAKSPGGIVQGDIYQVGSQARISVYAPSVGTCSRNVENSCGFGGASSGFTGDAPHGTVSVRRDGNQVEFTLFNARVANPTISSELSFSGTIRVTFPQSS